MSKIDRWENEGGTVSRETDRTVFMAMLKRAKLNYEEDTFGEKGTENDLVIKDALEGDLRIYVAFDENESLEGISGFHV